MSPDATIHIHSPRLANLPPAGYYLPNFVTEQEEAYLLQKVEETPKPKWKTVGSGRRLQYLGGTLSKKNALIPEPLPSWLTTFPDLISRITEITRAIQQSHRFTEPAQPSPGATSSATIPEASGGRGNDGDRREANGLKEAPRWGEGFQPNQVLINEYLPGQGIAPHEDGSAYVPIVATVSLGSGQTLDIFQYLSHTNPSPPLIASDPPTTTSLPSTTKPTHAPSPPSKASPRRDGMTSEPEPGIGPLPFEETGKPIATVPMARLYL